MHTGVCIIGSIISVEGKLMRIGPSRDISNCGPVVVSPIPARQLIAAISDTPAVNQFAVYHGAMTETTFGLLCVELLKRTEPFDLTLRATLFSSEVLEKCLVALLTSPLLRGLTLVGAGAGPNFAQMLARSGESHLESLAIIRDPEFGDIGAVGVATMISKSSHLYDVNLSGCGITDIGASALQMAARQQKKLVKGGLVLKVFLLNNDQISERFFGGMGRYLTL